MSAEVDAYDVDFSERVDGKRKSYKTSSRRRVLENGTVEYGDVSDDEDDDTLERRITWLKKQVEEAKDEFAKRQAASAQTNGEAATDKRLESLSQTLEELSLPEGTEKLQPAKKTETDSTDPSETPTGTDVGNKATYTVTYAPSYGESYALAKTADFDRRLVLLENGLGIASSIPEIGDGGLPRAILPTLDSMEKQIATLSQATTSNLDAISRRVRSLAQEQEKLNDSKEKAKMLREEFGKPLGNNSPISDDSEQDAKINALYGILPTIENLAPILPPLLDRLRSLRAIHTEAATASQTLDRIEDQQVEMASELKQWKEGLEKMENAVENGGKSIEGNVKVMEGWVKELEERMAKLS